MIKVFVNGIRLRRFRSVFVKIYREPVRTPSRKFASETTSETVVKMQDKPTPEEIVVTTENLNRCNLAFKCGKLARLADGCVTVTLNETTVMATAVSKCKALSNKFVPLTVLYQQKAAALGRIPLNFLRRELGQSENEILISRMIDRSIRPLFPEKFNWDTQVICNPLAMDGSTFADIVSINAASAALAVSNIPWNGPVGAVRVGIIDNELVINPDKKELQKSTLNLIVVCKAKNYLIMLEGSAANVLLPDILKAIKAGVKECQIIIKAIEKLSALCGQPKRTFEVPELNADLYKKIESLSSDSLRQIFQDFNHSKISRDEAILNLQNVVLETVKESCSDAYLASEIFSSVVKNVFRDLIFETNVRCDGRQLNMLRNIRCEVDLFQPLHGSALFQRGYTQVLCTVALDSPTSALKMDRISMLTSGVKEKNFFVHYEFPPYATKEVSKVGPRGRREIGHGSLAEKALKANIPDNFPFTIRLTSEVLESNGSSSMATVCGGTLALLDAGIPMKNPCAGVAIGIVTKSTDDNSATEMDSRILTDILGIEDFLGDMDLKVAGTKKHITAIQMDLKNKGLPMKLVVDCIKQAKVAIVFILKEMALVCPQARTDKKSNWPVIEKLTVPVNMRSKFIGPGGINVKKLEMETGVEVMEEVNGEFQLFAANEDAMKEAQEMAKGLIESSQEPVLEFGGVYTATVVEIKEHGCLVTLYPDMQPAFIPVSQLDQKKVAHPTALGIETGHKFQVRYFGRDPVSGSMRLSRKVLQATAPRVAQSFFKTENEKEKSLKENECRRSEIK